jgi:hypothetical protein
VRVHLWKRTDRLTIQESSFAQGQRTELPQVDRGSRQQSDNLHLLVRSLCRRRRRRRGADHCRRRAVLAVLGMLHPSGTPRGSFPASIVRLSGR